MPMNYDHWSVSIGQIRYWGLPPQDHCLLRHLCCRCEEHNVLMMKDARCRQKESITQPVDEPALSCHSLASLALSCHSRHHQPAFCHRHQKRPLGRYCLPKITFFSQHRSDHCFVSIIVGHSISQGIFYFASQPEACTLFVTCISRPLPNQTDLKLTTNSKLIEASASDVVLNWIELFVENAKSTFGFLCSNSRLVRNATFFLTNIGKIEWSWSWGFNKVCSSNWSTKASYSTQCLGLLCLWQSFFKLFPQPSHVDHQWVWQ